MKEMLPESESKSFVKVDGGRAPSLIRKVELRHQFPCVKIGEIEMGMIGFAVEVSEKNFMPSNEGVLPLTE
jgi:hypothetical protein